MMVLLAMLVPETSLYENQDNMPRDLFHPGSGAFEFRLPEVIITLALLARIVVRGRATRVGVAPLVWMAFGAWICVALVEGVLRHNDITQIPYEGKVIVYVVGGYALAAGVPIQRFFEGRAFERLVRWSALPATVVILMSRRPTRATPSTCPCCPLPDFGVDGSDAATIFAALGLIGLLLELAKEKRSRLTLHGRRPAPGEPVLSRPAGRAHHAGAAVTVILVVATGPTARRRLRVTCGGSPAQRPGRGGGGPGRGRHPGGPRASTRVQVPLGSTVAQTFDTQGKIESRRGPC